MPACQTTRNRISLSKSRTPSMSNHRPATPPVCTKTQVSLPLALTVAKLLRRKKSPITPDLWKVSKTGTSRARLALATTMEWVQRRWFCPQRSFSRSMMSWARLKQLRVSSLTSSWQEKRLQAMQWGRENQHWSQLSILTTTRLICLSNRLHQAIWAMHSVSKIWLNSVKTTQLSPSKNANKLHWARTVFFRQKMEMKMMIPRFKAMTKLWEMIIRLKMKWESWINKSIPHCSSISDH